MMGMVVEKFSIQSRITSDKSVQKKETMGAFVRPLLTQTYFIDDCIAYISLGFSSSFNNWSVSKV